MSYTVQGQQTLYYPVTDRTQLQPIGAHEGGGMGPNGYFAGSHIPWLVFIALTVAGIIVVAVLTLVLAGILVHWLKDSHFDPDCDCDDGDPCTKDLGLEGGCVYNPRPDGHECNSACFHPEPSESLFDGHRCQYHQFDQMGKFHPQSVCTGTECKGECILTSDCPDITFADGINGDSSKDCDSNACYYTLNVTDLNNDIDIPCDRNSAAYMQLCLKKLNMTDPIVSDNCLVAEPVCDPEPEYPLSANIVLCQYFFRCACPTENFIFVREEPEMKRDAAPSNKVEEQEDRSSSYEGLSRLLDDIKPNSTPKEATRKGRAKLWKKHQ